MNMYYYIKNGEKVGPLSKNKLSGQISEDTLVWKDDMENWSKASSLTDLKDLFQKEPPPIPDLEPKNDNESDGGFSNSVLWLIAIVIVGFLEFYDYADSWFYGVSVTATIIASYYALKSVKVHLRNILKITIANKIMNILIVTTIILGIAEKLFIKYETRIESSESFSNSVIALFLVFLGVLVVNWVYYFKLGRTLSKIENGVASKLSKFGYATAISYLVIIVISIISEDSSIILETVVSIIPLIYLISAFQLAEKKFGYRAT